MLNEITVAVMVKLGYTENENVLISTDATGQDNKQIKGFISTETEDSYINDKNNNSNKDLVTTAGHEASSYIDMQEGKDITQNRDDNNVYSDNFGDNLASYTNFALDITGQGSMTNSNNHNSGQVTTTPSVFNDNTIVRNNAEFGGLDKELGDNRVTVYSRTVIDSYGIEANHLFGVVDKREDGQPDMIFSLGADDKFITGGTPVVSVQEFDNVDASKTDTISQNDKNYFNNGTNDSQVIAVPDGMTQTQFDNTIIENAGNYNQVNNQYPNIVQTIANAISTGSNNNADSNYKNSNTYIDNVVESSGGKIKDFDGAVLQNSGEDLEKRGRNVQ